MLVNVSYNNKELIRQIDETVGKPFGLRARWLMKGIGSPKLFISAASAEIDALLNLTNSTNSCNIEMRPKGIIVRFRSILETFALVIPYYNLSIFKGDIGFYTIYKDHHFIKVKSGNKPVHQFFKKILAYKAENAPTSIEDLRHRNLP